MPYVKMGWNEKLLERKEKYIFTLWARGNNYSDEKYIGETENIAQVKYSLKIEPQIPGHYNDTTRSRLQICLFSYQSELSCYK